MEKTKFTCNYCFKEYSRKSFYNKHVLCCEIINNSKYENKMLREEQETPSIVDLYKVIKELTYNYNNIKKDLEEIKKHVYKTKKKKYLIEWLNESSKPKENIDSYIENITINVSDIVSSDFDNMLNSLFTEKTDIPICCFDQKNNCIFVYDNETWDVCSQEKFKSIIDTINLKILRKVTDYSLNNSNYYCKLIKYLMNDNLDYNKVKKKIYNILKTNITNIIEYEFV